MIQGVLLQYETHVRVPDIMKVAVMQPYLLPYIGYWELFSAADVFVILDDVQFIRRGWINRNRIRSDRPGKNWAYLTVPVRKARREARICDILMRFGSSWTQELSRRLTNVYGRDVLAYELVDDLISMPKRTDQTLLSALLDLLLATAKILRIETPMVFASKIDPYPESAGQERIIDLTLKMNGNAYLNLPGGQNLYERDAFLESGIELRILPVTNFQPWARCGEHLSVLDGILSGATHRIRNHLFDYKI